MKSPLIIPSRKLPHREDWWVTCDRTGELWGPFDPGVVWFETPVHITSDVLKLNALQRRTEMILNEAAASRDRLRRLLASGIQGGLRKLDTAWNPSQIPFLVGPSGALDTDAYLGDGAATGIGGLHVDDSKDDTNTSGQTGGAGGNADTESGDRGLGSGGGGGGGGRAGGTPGAGGGGGNGVAGSAGGAGTANGGLAGPIVPLGALWEAMRANSYTVAILQFGSGGGGGGRRSDGSANNGGTGGTGGSLYVEVVSGTLTTVARALTGSAGSGGQSDAGGGGGGAGGFWLGIAATIAYGSGTINTSAGAGESLSSTGGAGGNGRVIQVYFDASASLTVSGAQQNSYRIHRSVPLGGATFL